jgi:hypothetical protein
MSNHPWGDDDPFGDRTGGGAIEPTDRTTGRVDPFWDDDDPFGEAATSWEKLSSPPEITTPRRPRRVLLVIFAVLAVLVVGGLIALQTGHYSSLRDPRQDSAVPDIEPGPTSGSPPNAPSPTPPPTTTATPSATPTTAPTTALSTAPGPIPSNGSAAAALATLDVKGRAPQTNYDRDAFGQAWADVDRNGCDTRNDILKRDLTDVQIRPGTYGCLVERGTLDDPYSGKRLFFERGWDTSIFVQIDHVIALSNAWQTGAQFWGPDRREQFANDPLNLLAVDGPLNMQKSDGDAATWLPPSRAYWCEYVSRQVAVKAKYGLWATPPERDAIARVLTRCPNEPLILR